MDTDFLVDELLAFFLAEEGSSPAGPLPDNGPDRRRLLQALLDPRPPKPVPEAVLSLQDKLLALEREEKGWVRIRALPTAAEEFPGTTIPRASKIALWRGDITRLDADAIVNAANSLMLGCFLPLHACIDNAIHAAAGIRLRLACHAMMLRDHPSGHWEEPTGQARITPGFNLPSLHVLHTVGPIVDGPLTREHERQLVSSYQSCLRLATENGCRSLAFCCISTGVFRFPGDRAAAIALDTVAGYLDRHPDQLDLVVFNVFSERDHELYRRLLS